MISRLFDSTETTFTSLGFGKLTDMLSCTMTEELNGEYSIVFTYPIDGILFSEIKEQRIVSAMTPKPSTNGNKEQLFRIVGISKPLSGVVTVSANHISYDLNGVVIPAMALTGRRKFSDQAAVYYSYAPNTTKPFTFSGNVDAGYDISVPYTTQASMRAHLGGMENSLIDVYGGELEFDRYEVIAHQHRGSNAHYTIRYGVDLTDAQIDSTTAELYSHVYPYVNFENENLEAYDSAKDYKYGDKCISSSKIYFALSDFANHAPSGTTADNAYWAYLTAYTSGYPNSTLTLTEKVVAVPGSVIEGCEKILPLDCAELLADIVPNENNLRFAAEIHIDAHSFANAMPSITISFVPIWDTDEYADLPIDVLGIGDTVGVHIPMLNADLSAKIVAFEYDVLKERYINITLGRMRKNIADTIVELQRKVR